MSKSSRKSHFVIIDGELAAVALGYKNKEDVMKAIDEHLQYGEDLWSFIDVDLSKLKSYKKIKITSSCCGFYIYCKIGTHSSDKVWVDTHVRIGDTFIGFHNGVKCKFYCNDIVIQGTYHLHFLDKM